MTTSPPGSPPPRASAVLPQDYPTAAELLNHGETLARGASSARRRAWIAAMHARALAAAANRDQALAALTRAHTAIDTTTDPARGTDFFDAPRLDGITGSVYLLRRDTGPAEDYIRRSLHHSSADAKDRALLTLDLAADAGVCPIIDRAQAVRRRMAGWTGGSAADLDARIATLAS
jgi:hypothetical protein